MPDNFVKHFKYAKSLIDVVSEGIRKLEVSMIEENYTEEEAQRIKQWIKGQLTKIINNI